MTPPLREARATAAPTSSSNRARLGRPVNASWYARYATFSSASLRSVMSTITPCQNRGRPRSPPTGVASSRTHTVRPSTVASRYSWRMAPPDSAA